MEMCLTGCIWVNALHTITYDDLGKDTQNTINYELPKKRKKPLKMPISWYFQEFVNYFHPEIYCPICAATSAAKSSSFFSSPSPVSKRTNFFISIWHPSALATFWIYVLTFSLFSALTYSCSNRHTSSSLLWHRCNKIDTFLLPAKSPPVHISFCVQIKDSTG